MAVFARRFHRPVLTCGAFFLLLISFPHFNGPAATVDAQQSQQPEAHDPGTSESDSANSASSITRLSQKDLRATDRFLEKHKNVNKDLEKHPSFVADPHYLKKHKDFREFLEQNPDINAAIRKDPVWFMQNQHARFEGMHQKM
jgi:hypothetical protein